MLTLYAGIVGCRGYWFDLLSLLVHWRGQDHVFYDSDAIDKFTSLNPKWIFISHVPIQMNMICSTCVWLNILHNLQMLLQMCNCSSLVSCKWLFKDKPVVLKTLQLHLGMCMHPRWAMTVLFVEVQLHVQAKIINQCNAVLVNNVINH